MTLEKAIHIAVDAHKGAVDKGGRPYILHPLSVMQRLTTDTERIVAVLHDVVEDTDWTLDRLRQEGFDEEVITALDGVTRRSGETYEDFIKRAASNPISRRVKIADLEDNLDPTRRLDDPKSYDLIARYKKALRTLGREVELIGSDDVGNIALYGHKQNDGSIVPWGSWPKHIMIGEHEFEYEEEEDFNISERPSFVTAYYRPKDRS